MSKAKFLNFVVIGNIGNRRVEAFQKALQCFGLPIARLFSYSDLLAGKAHLGQFLETEAINVVRIESPERDFEVEKALLRFGADAYDEIDPSNQLFDRCPAYAIGDLAFDKGLILYPRQWYLGFRLLLNEIKHQLNEEAQPDFLLNQPDDIALMFDKPACHRHLADNNLPVAKSLGFVHSYDELIEKMQQTHCNSVFAKLANGSSASGVVAYRTNGRQHQATTTVEIAGGLYNSRKLRTYTDQKEIAELINILCRQYVQVEQWIPKARYQKYNFDLRVVVIAQKAHHVVVRLSQSPITNLHLSNGRTSLENLLAENRLSLASWEAARITCEQTMQKVFPNSFYAGLDLLIASDYKHHTLAEVNAFGDLLYDTFYQGRDTYAAEIAALLAQIAHD